ncbi:tRNA(m(1)G37)methyltransferase [Schaereria dolodes]|nr:tRNA(m(1)G37)methyltransferase [Schaereria dolodes]
MRVLDRSFFKKRVPLAAARVLENKQIGRCRAELNPDLLQLERMANVKPDGGEDDRKKGRKALLLRPDVRPDDTSSWSSKLLELINQEQVSVVAYELDLNYDYWTYHDIMTAILPQDEHNELPTSFSNVGHIAHLNLRDQYLPYKTLIANVLMDKNPAITTVINKVDDVGTHSQYRTFDYELLAGDPNMNVEIKEADCVFRFDYSKVYWNSRLNTEHGRLVDIFRPGEAVCDVMAGVGPFAVPAGKKKVFVWANDLNPDSFAGLDDAVSSNKVTQTLFSCYKSFMAVVDRSQVSQFVKVFNEDGLLFIRSSARRLMAINHEVKPVPKTSRLARSVPSPSTNPQIPLQIFTQPKTFNHYVMNLPATATTFLGAFIGLYHSYETMFTPHTSIKLPMIHMYCFSTKSDDNKEEKSKICEAISERIEYKITPETPELDIWDVRDVAPQKRMFCASFRLPPEVAFRVCPDR